MQDSIENPRKQRRFEKSNPIFQLNTHAPTAQAQAIHNFVLRLRKVPLSSYDTKEGRSVIDSTLIQCHDSLRSAMSSDAHLFRQLRGTLLQWLHYVATTQKPRDITREDDTENKRFRGTVARICSCLNQVYQFDHDGHEFESLYIIVLTFLTVVEFDENEEFAARNSSLLQLLGNYIHLTGTTHTLPFSMQQELVFNLLEVHSSEADISAAQLDRAPTSLTSTAPSSPYQILNFMAKSAANQQSTTARSAKTAVDVLKDKQTLAKRVSESDTFDVFRILCILRVSGVRSTENEETMEVIESLRQLILIPSIHRSTEACFQRFQALDCLVKLCALCDYQSFRSPLANASLNIFFSVLSYPPKEIPIQALHIKAVEGLQYILPSSEAICCCARQLFRKHFHVDSTLVIPSLVKICCRDYLTSQREEFWSCRGKVSSNEQAIGAAEIVIFTVSTYLQDFSNSVMIDLPPTFLITQLMSILRAGARCEHIAFLAVQMICEERATFFIEYAKTHSELLSGLSENLCSEDTSNTTKCSILGFFRDLVGLYPSLSTAIVRQAGVLKSITGSATADEESWDNSDSRWRRELAIDTLLRLSGDVSNRVVVARQAKVLSAMIQCMRESVSPRVDTTFSNEYRELFDRQCLKQRIMQLASLM